MSNIERRERSREKTRLPTNWKMYDDQTTSAKKDGKTLKKRKTVMFSENVDIKVFKCSDEPSRRGLSDV